MLRSEGNSIRVGVHDTHSGGPAISVGQNVGPGEQVGSGVGVGVQEHSRIAIMATMGTMGTMSLLFRVTILRLSGKDCPTG